MTWTSFLGQKWDEEADNEGPRPQHIKEQEEMGELKAVQHCYTHLKTWWCCDGSAALPEGWYFW